MTEKADLKEDLRAVAASAERLLDQLLPMKDPDIDRVTAAMRYSLLAGGKRLRPYLSVLFARICGGREETALLFGVALEMIHTYSLIHDDLPAMDNDDLRRGKPTCHRAFDEATAILAGDALLSAAFGVIAGSGEDSRKIAEATCVLSDAAGHRGMIGGQIMDMKAEAGALPAEKLAKLQSLKTGALFRAACRLGCIASGVYDGEIPAVADRFAEKFGLAFQVEDDLLDAIGDEKLLGKPVGSDEKSGKVTFYTLLGKEGAEAFADHLTEEACDAVAALPGGERAAELARHLLSRKN